MQALYGGLGKQGTHAELSLAFMKLNLAFHPHSPPPDPCKGGQFGTQCFDSAVQAPKWREISHFSKVKLKSGLYMGERDAAAANSVGRAGVANCVFLSPGGAGRRSLRSVHLGAFESTYCIQKREIDSPAEAAVSHSHLCLLGPVGDFSPGKGGPLSPPPHSLRCIPMKKAGGRDE